MKLRRRTIGRRRRSLSPPSDVVHRVPVTHLLAVRISLAVSVPQDPLRPSVLVEEPLFPLLCCRERLVAYVCVVFIISRGHSALRPEIARPDLQHFV